MPRPAPEKRKPVRTSAAQIRDFSVTGFEAIEEIAAWGMESKDLDERTRKLLRLIQDLASNFKASI